jgi:hypothetical protein
MLTGREELHWAPTVCAGTGSAAAAAAAAAALCLEASTPHGRLVRLNLLRGTVTVDGAPPGVYRADGAGLLTLNA